MVRSKLLILSVFCIMFFAQSCVHGDLDDCPPMVRYAVAFKYTSHTETRDRFYDDVKKINLYVFDENNLVYTTTTELSPYDENFNIPLDLPMGKYHIVAWGNVLEDQPFSVAPNNFVKGETTLAEARLILEKTKMDVDGAYINDTKLEKLFWSEIENDTIPLYVNRIDTMSLINNTENFRIVLHWDHSNVNMDEIADHSKVVVRLQGSNSRYSFRGGRVPESVNYAPYNTYLSDHTTDSVLTADTREWLKINYYSNDFDEISKSTVYDFSILRLYKDIPLYLVVEYWEPTDDGKYIKNEVAKVDLVSQTSGFQYLFANRGIAEAQWQSTFDINELYRVDMHIIQGSKYFDSFATGTIKIKDWWKIDVEGGGGAD